MLISKNENYSHLVHKKFEHLQNFRTGLPRLHARKEHCSNPLSLSLSLPEWTRMTRNDRPNKLEWSIHPHSFVGHRRWSMPGQCHPFSHPNMLPGIHWIVVTSIHFIACYCMAIVWPSINATFLTRKPPQISDLFQKWFGIQCVNWTYSFLTNRHFDDINQLDATVVHTVSGLFIAWGCTCNMYTAETTAGPPLIGVIDRRHRVVPWR